MLFANFDRATPEPEPWKGRFRFFKF